MGREIADEDVFFYNVCFTSKFYKVKVGTVSAQKETEPEKADTRHKARPAPLAREPHCPAWHAVNAGHTQSNTLVPQG